MSRVGKFTTQQIQFLYVCVFSIFFLFSKFIIFPLSAFLCWRYTIYIQFITTPVRVCIYMSSFSILFYVWRWKNTKLKKKNIYFLNGREEKTSALLGHTHTQHFFFVCMLEGGHFQVFNIFFFSISSQSFFVILFSLRLPQQQQKKRDTWHTQTNTDRTWTGARASTVEWASHDSSLFTFFCNI